MSLGERLISFRKKLNLSQEEVAEKLGVTRQTVSKWETDQSTPDFDKIVPICELYSISTNELINGEAEEIKSVDVGDNNKRTKGIILGVFLYFVAVISIMITVPVLTINPVVGAAIFLGVCAIATCIIIYTCITYKKEKKEEDTLYKQIDNIIAIIFLIIYLLVSFISMAWHITWIIWIIYALVSSIVKLILSLRGDDNEK
ncbi:MAG: helix-turn-helix transcriptional regulator [Bacilli bacterium]|nr:helix-turn-helix transcriptional regulator [Bacilli bacterium]